MDESSSGNVRVSGVWECRLGKYWGCRRGRTEIEEPVEFLIFSLCEELEK